MKPKRVSHIIAELNDILKEHGDLIIVSDGSSEFSWQCHPLVLDRYYDGEKTILDKVAEIACFQEGAEESYNRYVNE